MTDKTVNDIGSFCEDLENVLETTKPPDFTQRKGKKESMGAQQNMNWQLETKAVRALLIFFQNSNLVIANILFKLSNRRPYTW